MLYGWLLLDGSYSNQSRTGFPIRSRHYLIVRTIIAITDSFYVEKVEETAFELLFPDPLLKFKWIDLYLSTTINEPYLNIQYLGTYL